MKKVRFALFSAAAALTAGLLTASQAAAAPNLLDGNFEDPAIAANSFAEVSTGASGATTLPGWTGNYINGSAHEYLIDGNIQDLNGNYYGITPFGNQYLGLNAVYRNSFRSIESQVVSGFTVGQLYALTVYIADLDGATDPNVSVVASANSGTGNTLASQTFAAPVGGPYLNGFINFVPETLVFTPTSDTVSFSIGNQSKTGTMGIDNVSIAAVPEPTTVVGILLGAAAWAGAAVRRRRASVG